MSADEKVYKAPMVDKREYKCWVEVSAPATHNVVEGISHALSSMVDSAESDGKAIDWSTFTTDVETVDMVNALGEAVLYSSSVCLSFVGVSIE